MSQHVSDILVNNINYITVKQNKKTKQKTLFHLTLLRYDNV